MYLTREQRTALDELGRRRRRSLAELIREAVDAYIGEASPDAAQALDRTFNSAPDFEVPSRDEWSERERRIWRG